MNSFRRGFRGLIKFFLGSELQSPIHIMFCVTRALICVICGFNKKIIQKIHK